MFYDDYFSADIPPGNDAVVNGAIQLPVLYVFYGICSSIICKGIQLVGFCTVTQRVNLCLLHRINYPAVLRFIRIAHIQCKQLFA